MNFDQVRHYADNSIRRGCGFALLAIFTFMFGLAGEPGIALRSGAVLTTFATVLLYWRGLKAPARNYRETEVWIMIRDLPGLPKDRLQHFIGEALAASYFQHARIAAYLALTMWVVSFLIWLAEAL